MSCRGWGCVCCLVIKAHVWVAASAAAANQSGGKSTTGATGTTVAVCATAIVEPSGFTPKPASPRRMARISAGPATGTGCFAPRFFAPGRHPLTILIASAGPRKDIAGALRGVRGKSKTVLLTTSGATASASASGGPSKTPRVPLDPPGLVLGSREISPFLAGAFPQRLPY